MVTFFISPNIMFILQAQASKAVMNTITDICSLSLNQSITKF